MHGNGGVLSQLTRFYTEPLLLEISSILILLELRNYYYYWLFFFLRNSSIPLHSVGCRRQRVRICEAKSIKQYLAPSEPLEE